MNSWSHLALTYDGAALRLFVNGQQVAQTALNASLYDDGSPLRIGGNVVWREYFSGLIDEVREVSPAGFEPNDSVRPRVSPARALASDA
ncbi:LamG domain-containing protein, partial [Nonomuraea sp. H19]|uniref:LamG domain-containing protein n=1 Tax=Nonomuraea sp. H19 TaxID=3452206 RepID=UPI003F8B174A